MLCIAVTPSSRTLAKVDLLNAARRADLVELCLDHFSKDPDVGDLIAGCPKPVIVSCRSTQHGGRFDGGETHRLGLLRQAIVAGPAYVELDVDAAEALPRFGETKRLVAFHSPHKPLKKIEATVERAVKEFHADAVKFTWPTPHLSAAWPLIYAVSQKLSVPVVGQGIGAGGLTFSLIARRFGCPWIYAALEKGMEDVPGQPTVEELDACYDARSIDRRTRFVAFAGFPPNGSEDADADAARGAICGRWNAAARTAGVPHRALPLEAGRFDHLGEMLRILKVRAAALGPALGAEAAAGWSRFAAPAPGTDGRSTPTAVVKEDDGWRSRASARAATADALAAYFGGHLERRQVAVLGAGPGATGLCRTLRDRGATVAIADPDDDAAAALARSLNARAALWRAVYMTHFDALIRGEATSGGVSKSAALTVGGTRPDPSGAGPVPIGEGPRAFAESGFEPRLKIADVTAVWGDTDFLAAARRHGCTVVEPAAVRSAVLADLFRTVTETEWLD
ncbi:type I 3-dehydroquinate dehydratase [Alienimonas sp. DA493]|uniref:type I 3-dehydroquinate dehydratase n=1 Tax=Alienimonas sp. DA493 TaxID=3373605 RepID=UPI0037544477